MQLIQVKLTPWDEMFRNLGKQYPVSSFVVLSYLLSWTFLYPSYRILLSQESFHPLALIGLIGAYGPSISAVLMQSLEEGSRVRPLLRSLLRVKVPISTYMMAILLPISLYLLASLAAFTGTQTSPQFDLVHGLQGIPIWFLLALPFGPMGEELGWRGYLLPKLLARHSLLSSTVLVGIIWGCWHLASFTFPGAAIPDFLPVNVWTIMLFVMNTILLSFLYTAVFLRTKGSTFVAIITHAFLNAASNISTDFLGDTSKIDILFAAYVFNMILVGFVGWIFWPRKLAE